MQPRTLTPSAAARRIAPVLACLTLLATTAKGRPELGGDVIDRVSNQVNHWCPSEHVYYGFDGSFFADGEEALLVFTIVNHDGPEWLKHGLDNIGIAERAVFDAYHETLDPDSFLCIQQPTSAFFFHAADSAGLATYVETFDAGIGPEWSLGSAGYFDAARSAPGHLRAPTGTSGGGSLGIGFENDPTVLVEVTLTLDGLTAGTEYVVAFWCVNRSGMPNFPDDISLTIYGEERWTAITGGGVAAGGDSYGVGWVDMDADGDLDLHVQNRLSQGNVVLFQSTPEIWFAFTPPDLADPGRAPGAAWGDIDGDRDLDVFVPGDTGAQSRLLRNDGGGTFADVTIPVVTAPSAPERGVFGDIDADGDLDLYIACDGPNALLRNDGGALMVSFADVSSAPVDDPGTSVDAAFVDADGDGDLDIAVANANGSLRLYRNGGGTFDDATPAPFLVGGNASAMAWGDADADGDLDCFAAHPSSGDRHYRNDGWLTFVVATPPAFDHTSAASAASWVDVDNDADLDLFIVVTSADNRLYRNDGGGSFLAIDDESFDTLASLTAAWGDYDEDGDLDAYIGNFDSETGSNILVRNENATGNHWLHVDLLGTVSNAYGVGARIERLDGVQPTRQVGGSTSASKSHDSLTEELGLGPATSADLRVRWPSGIVQDVLALAADQRILIEEPDLVLVDRAGDDFCDAAASPNAVWEPGEEITLFLPLEAIGSRSHTGASGALTSTTPGITVTDGFVTWPDIPAGMDAGADPPYARVRVDPGVPCFSAADLLLEVTSEQGGPYRYAFQEAIGTSSTLDAVVTIPDGTTEVLTTELVVPWDVTLTDLDVRVHLEHPRVGDLRIALESPGGEAIRLIDRPGPIAGGPGSCPDKTVDVRFDDEAAIDAQHHCEGTDPWLSGAARPLDALATFDGQSSRGTWRLHLSDHGVGNGAEDARLRWTLLPTPSAPATSCEGCASAVATDPGIVAGPLALTPAAPNPASSLTRIGFQLPERGDVRLVLHDVAGRVVRRLVEGEMSAGGHEVTWDGRDDAGRRAAAGVYTLILTHAAGRRSGRIHLLR